MRLTRFLKKEEFRPTQLPLIKEKRKTRGKEEKVGGRKAILALFVASLFFSSLFWFWGKLSEKKEEKKALTPIAAPTPVDIKKAKKEVVAKVLAETVSLRGEYGFYVYNLVGRYEYGAHEKEVFTAASLIKLPVILTLYQEAEAGRISLEDKYKLKDEDKLIGAGSLKERLAGTVLTYRELIHLMCRDSDNTAFNIVRKKLGDKKIEETIKNLGMERTDFGRNETSPYDIGLFFKKLYAGSVISRRSRDEIIDFLTETAFEDRIPAGVAEGVKVSHKIGNETGAYSDAGIVFSSKPFILVVMSKNASREQATEVIPKITKIVFEEETR